MRPDKHILSVILLIAALAYTLLFVFSGMGNHMDPLYWLHKYEQMEGGWMAVGTILTGGAIVRICGTQLLPLRIAGWLCTVSAIALPYCILLRPEHRRANLHWLALAFALMGYGAFQELSPGTLSVLLLSLLWVTRSPVVLGLAVAVRFPNILALLVLLPLWGKRSIKNIPIALLTAGVVYMLGYLLITPAPMDVAMSSHQLARMASLLWSKGALLAGAALMWAGIGCLPGVLPEQWRQNGRWLTIAGVVMGAVVAYCVLKTTGPKQWYNTDLTYMLSAGVLMTAMAVRRRELRWMALLVAVATLGTDVGWLKLFPTVLVLLPISGAVMPQDIRRYLWPVMAGLTVAVMVRMSTNSIGGGDLRKNTVTATAAPYMGIRVTEQEAEYMAQIRADYDSIKGKREILAVGSDMHLMRALTGCEAARYNEFWSNIYDSVYTAKYQTLIAEEKPTVFCFLSPQFRTQPSYRHRHSALEEMLRAEGYEQTERRKYTIYKLRE